MLRVSVIPLLLQIPLLPRARPPLLRGSVIPLLLQMDDVPANHIAKHRNFQAGKNSQMGIARGVPFRYNCTWHHAQNETQNMENLP